MKLSALRSSNHDEFPAPGSAFAVKPRARSEYEDGGLAVVRIKPLGAGGGGGESSATLGSGASVWSDGSSVVVEGGTRQAKRYSYPEHIITPEHEQGDLYDMFMPQRVDAFLNGMNVNIICYGQTGSGKTHTMFGPPGLMSRAAHGEFGIDICPLYGLCPRGLIHIVNRLADLRQHGTMRYTLTASAVELTVTQGNLDMFRKAGTAPPNKVPAEGKSAGQMWWSGSAGVSIDTTTKPPVLTGMEEVLIDDPGSLLALFGAISSRNTAGTGMNDSSSRSHCIVWLTLYAFDPGADTLRTSRFQFVDLAGSERMRDAHGTGWSSEDMGAVEGMVTNFGLIMLSQRLREVVAAMKCGKSPKEVVARSFKTQLEPDLIPLLSQSLSGSGLSLVCVCLSGAPANTSQSINALDFGHEFSRLRMRPTAAPAFPLKAYQARAAKLIESGAKSGGGANGKYAIIRATQGFTGKQMMRLMPNITGALK